MSSSSSFVLFLSISTFAVSLDLLDDNFEYDAALSEFKSDVLPSWSDLAQLSHCVQSLLRSNDNSPLAAVALLQQLDEHVGRIICETFRCDGRYDVVLAKVFELLVSVLGPFDPEHVLLRGLALIRNIAIKQAQPLLHRHEIQYEHRRCSIVAQAVVPLFGGQNAPIVVVPVNFEVASHAIQLL